MVKVELWSRISWTQVPDMLLISSGCYDVLTEKSVYRGSSGPNYGYEVLMSDEIRKVTRSVDVDWLMD